MMLKIGIRRLRQATHTLYRDFDRVRINVCDPMTASFLYSFDAFRRSLCAHYISRVYREHTIAMQGGVRKTSNETENNVHGMERGRRRGRWTWSHLWTHSTPYRKPLFLSPILLMYSTSSQFGLLQRAITKKKFQRIFCIRVILGPKEKQKNKKNKKYLLSFSSSSISATIRVHHGLHQSNTTIQRSSLRIDLIRLLFMRTKENVGRVQANRVQAEN